MVCLMLEYVCAPFVCDMFSQLAGAHSGYQTEFVTSGDSKNLGCGGTNRVTCDFCALICSDF